MVKDAKQQRKFVYIGVSCAAYVIAAWWLIDLIRHDKSSTAAIAYVALPFVGTMAALAAAALVFSAYALTDARAKRIAWTHRRVWLAGAILVTATALAGNQWRYQQALAIASNPQALPEELIEVSQRWNPLGHEEMRVNLAKNPATPPELLAKIFKEGKTQKVAFLVGIHPKAPTSLLNEITSGPRGRDYARVYGVARNPNITPTIAARLAAVDRKDFKNDLEYKLYQSSVLGSLAENPATPQAVFNQIAAIEHPDYHLAMAVIQSERATCSQIEHAGRGGDKMVLETAKWHLDRRGCQDPPKPAR